MLSSVLHSERAITVNIAIMRAFVRLRELVASSSALSKKLAELERTVGSPDAAIVELFNAIRALMAPPSSAAGQSALRPIWMRTEMSDSTVERGVNRDGPVGSSRLLRLCA